MTRLNAAVTTFGILVLLVGARAQADEIDYAKEPKFIPAGTRLFVEGAFDNSVDNPKNPDPAREVPWGQMSEDEMFFGAFTWKNVE